MQLEDDIVARSGYLYFIKQRVLKEAGNWFLMEFSNLGFIGKLFRTASLSVMADFTLLFHREKPVDWLLDHFLTTKVCNPEQGITECASAKRLMKVFKAVLTDRP